MVRSAHIRRIRSGLRIEFSRFVACLATRLIEAAHSVRATAIAPSRPLSPPDFDRWVSEDPHRRIEVLRTIDEVPWGDLHNSIYDLELTLCLLLGVTADDGQLWKDEGWARYGDEFSVSPDQAAAMSPEMRAAYVAPLVSTLALHYGADPGPDPLRGFARSGSPAHLLRELDRATTPEPLDF